MARDPKEFDAQLAAVPLFEGLSGRQRKKLLERSRVVEHAEGRQIVAEGEGALALHLIISGEAAVSIAGRHVRDLSVGDYFGEISLIDGKPRSATVTTTSPLQTVAVPHLAFRSLIEDDPGVAQQLLETLCARLRDVDAPSA